MFSSFFISHSSIVIMVNELRLTAQTVFEIDFYNIICQDNESNIIKIPKKNVVRIMIYFFYF